MGVPKYVDTGAVVIAVLGLAVGVIDRVLMTPDEGSSGVTWPRCTVAVVLAGYTMDIGE